MSGVSSEDMLKAAGIAVAAYFTGGAALGALGAEAGAGAAAGAGATEGAAAFGGATAAAEGGGAAAGLGAAEAGAAGAGAAEAGAAGYGAVATDAASGYGGFGGAGVAGYGGDASLFGQALPMSAQMQGVDTGLLANQGLPMTASTQGSIMGGADVPMASTWDKIASAANRAGAAWDKMPGPLKKMAAESVMGGPQQSPTIMQAPPPRQQQPQPTKSASEIMGGLLSPTQYKPQPMTKGGSSLFGGTEYDPVEMERRRRGLLGV